MVWYGGIHIAVVMGWCGYQYIAIRMGCDESLDTAIIISWF
jgi:hypothetical protein